MAEVNPDVLAQMKRIWSALNDGTVDVASANDALKRMHDFLTGVAYEHGTEAAEAAGRAEPEEGEEADEGSDEHPHKRSPRKKR